MKSNAGLIMNKTGKLNIAVLVACHNRKEKTLKFLESLVNQGSFKKLLIDIYLLDDGSTDGTAKAVKEKYPYINILAGTGNLFWARGMRTVWEYAMAQKRYDLFFLFNDDVILFDDALENLIGHYLETGKGGTILIGSTLDPEENKISYGGILLKLHFIKQAIFSLIEPGDNKPIKCRFANANIMLVDHNTINKIGIFPAAYTHYLADFDYTFSAYKAGINVLISPGYYGYCVYDHQANWLPAGSPLKQRINYLFSPKGLAYKEYLFFIRKHFPYHYFSEFIKLWMKTLFPVIWDKFKKTNQ